MPEKTRIRATMIALALSAAVLATPPAVQAQFVTGLQGAAGSTIGPGGDLFVTEGLVGRVSRVDPDSGAVTTFAEGLPPSVIGVGGAADVAFIGDTGYVLVTLVSLFSGAVDGIYRIDGPNSYTVIADLGAYTLANPSAGPWDIPTGVQWSIEPYRGGLLVSEAHHNRVLWVSQDGEIRELKAFGNVVPTGMEVLGSTVYLALTGPAPHEPEDGQVVSFDPESDSVQLEASGARLLLDVESGRGRSLFALSQGQWNGQFPGSPAIENDGALWEINADGSLRLVAGGIDRPTSLEIIGNDAYVVTLTGDIVRIGKIASPPFGR
ncbi:MAG TPA: ScyD/ScyE family protein [Woeseiaceae bacterium]|nr:ScyD/ScyE family protein [Woeseiaceae bacterium]